MCFPRLISLVRLTLVLGVVSPMAFAATLPPRLVKAVEPTHPELLAADGIDGVATLSMKILENGTVSEIKVVSSTQSDFGRAAKDAAEQWEFKPATKDGEPVAVRVIQEFKFAAPLERKLMRIAGGREVVVATPEPLVDWADLESEPRQTKSPRNMPYPENYEGSGLSGDVEIKFIITTAGEVINPEIVSTTDAAFNDSALEALLGYEWRTPRQGRDDVNVSHSMTIHVAEK
jgi:TonB family protein